MTNIDKFRNCLYLVIVGFLFLLLHRPYFTWQNALPGYALIIFSFLLWRGRNANLCYLFPALLLFIFLLARFVRSSISSTAILSFLLVLILLSKENSKIVLFKKAKFLYSIIIFVSLCVYFLVTFLSIDIGSTIIEPWNEGKSYSYSQYPFFVVPYNAKDILLHFRFYGLFEEPGVVGTIATSFLIAENYNLKNWQNLIIFVSGIFTFSMFFYAITVLYLLIKGDKKTVLGGSIVIILLFFAVSQFNSSEFNLLNFYEARVSHKEGAFIGDNRSNEVFDKAFDEFVRSPDLFLGKGPNAHAIIAPGIQTWKLSIYDEGLMAVILELMVFVLYINIAARNNRRARIISTVYFFLFFYQRPSFVMNPGDFFLLMCIPVCLAKTSSGNKGDDENSLVLIKKLNS